MALGQLFMILAFVTLVCTIETDDIEHKKRGAGKTTGVNTIPTGIQKPDYTYAIYSQNPNTQSSSSSQSYQAQVANSFYPNQASSQYYSPVSSNEGTHSSSPQANAPHQSSAQFVPLNFVPNSGYQAKYQIVPAKANGNQLALIQPSSGYSPQNLHLPQPSVYSQPTNQINPHNNQLVSSVLPHEHFNFPSNYQPLSLGTPYLTQTPTILLPHFNHPFYNNLLYSSPGQNFYYPTNTQPKYGYTQSSPSTTSNEYEKLQGPVSQSNSKEATQNSEAVHGDSLTSYKNAYTSSRGQTYTKLK